MYEKVLLILVLLQVSMILSKNASFDHSTCPPNTIKLLRVTNFTTNFLRLFYSDESSTRFQIVAANCTISKEELFHKSNYWKYGPNYVDFMFENLTTTSYTYTCYVYLKDIDRVNCTYENTINFKNNSTSKIDITPLICDNRRFYNISWNQGDDDEPVEISYNEALRLPCHQFLNYSEDNNSVILPEKLTFSGYHCNLSALDWIDVTSKELMVTNDLPDFIINRCDCNSNKITLDEIKCFFGNYLRMGYVDTSSSIFQIDSITIKNVDNQVTERSVYYKYVPGFVDVCFKNLYNPGVYSLYVSYFDVDRMYCAYNGILNFKWEDLGHCNNWKLKNVQKVGDSSYYEVFYTSTELFVDYQHQIKVSCIETATKKIVSEAKFHNVTRTNQISSFGVFLEDLETDTNYTLRVAFNGNNYSCFDQSITFTVPPPQEIISNDQNFDLFILLILMSIILLGCLTHVLWKTCQRNFLKLRHFFISKILSRRGSTRHEVNPLYIPLGIGRPDPYEIPRENIEILTPIGDGAFGTVYYAKVHKLFGCAGYSNVAVKQLKENAPTEERKDFQDEIKIWKKIGSHDHIVKMLACVTDSEPYTIVMELIFSGDLRCYLLSLRDMWHEKTNNVTFSKGASDCVYIKPYSGTVIRSNFKNAYIRRTSDDSIDSALPESPGTPLTDAPQFNIEIKSAIPKEMMKQPQAVLDSRELENFAQQIASGMAYLEGKGIVHRDLAARNILITYSKTLKITDFGMSKVGPYVNRSSKRVPIRWMAIESIIQFKTNHKSDIWSFGVVLWEIGTLGAFPYNNLHDNFVLPYLKAGNRLQRPEICTDGLYDIMLKCWLEDPNARPSFSDLQIMLNTKKHHTYVEFNQLRDTYVFPPAVDNSTT